MLSYPFWLIAAVIFGSAAAVFDSGTATLASVICLATFAVLEKMDDASNTN